MFKKQCANEDTHEPHVWQKVWEKKDLPDLLHPESYPDWWTAVYQCSGRDIVGWTVQYLHEDCTPCEACADMAVDRALARGLDECTWREIGVHDTIRHMAEVKRL